MSRFKPVQLSEPLGRRVSQTMLRHFQACPRSGFLYAETRGQASSVQLVRGTALHEVIGRAVQAMVEHEEPMVEADVVSLIVDDVLAEQHVPFEEHDYIRECAYRWCGEFTVDPGAVLAVERLMVLDVAGWQVRSRVDFTEAREHGMAVYVADWKSARAAPGFEEIARKRPDGTRIAKNFQLVLYALALAFGRPVRVEDGPCESCDGTTFFAGERGGPRCPECEGTGEQRLEIPEPFPLATQAERFDLEFVYPGIKSREGVMVRRGVSLTRLELLEYRQSLEGLLVRLERSEREGDWPAIQSEQACGECPAQRLCPIPRELRDYAGRVNTLEEASEAAEVLERRADEISALRRELRNLAKAHGWEIRYGANRALRFVYSESDRIDDKEAMFAAVQRAVDYGEPFDRSRFVRTVGSSNFKAVTLTDEELEQPSELEPA